MTLSTNITNNARRGYRDASMNKNELIWNAQIAQNFLKGNAATISFEVYDILRQQSNISRSLTADMRSVSEYNGINSYCMLRFSYRLNVLEIKKLAAICVMVVLMVVDLVARVVALEVADHTKAE